MAEDGSNNTPQLVQARPSYISAPGLVAGANTVGTGFAGDNSLLGKFNPASVKMIKPSMANRSASQSLDSDLCGPHPSINSDASKDIGLARKLEVCFLYLVW
jgi:hypothetical protein